MTAGYFATCICPAVWNGVLPPSCPIHNPAAFYGPVTTYTWVRSTLWERDNPQARGALAYGPPWTSTNALANYSFACVCHKRPRYRDRRQPKHQAVKSKQED